MASLAQRTLGRWGRSLAHHPPGTTTTTRTACSRHASTAPGFTWSNTRYRYAASHKGLNAVQQRRQRGDSTSQLRQLRLQHSSARPLRGFHTYFVTHLPSSSLHPDSGRSPGPGHGLPRDASTPHTQSPGSSPAVAPPNMSSQNLTVVRIPLRRAKHHFGSATARGSRPYNEDTDQAGTIDIPAFAKRAPQSVVRQGPGRRSPQRVLWEIRKYSTLVSLMAMAGRSARTFCGMSSTGTSKKRPTSSACRALCVSVSIGSRKTPTRTRSPCRRRRRSPRSR